MALFSYENMIHKKKSTIFEIWKKFDSLQLCSPLRHMDKWHLFGSLQSHAVWSQVVIIQVKQKSVSRSPFFYFYWYYNTRNWYWDRFFRTYKARLVWRSKHKSWCCNTSIWYCPIESMPKVGTFQSNFGIKICGANSKNSHF